MTSLHGKVVVVTGAASGIGRAMAHRFAEGGAAVVATDIADGIEQLAVELGASCIGIRADVTRLDDMEGLCAAALERFGRLDAVCNNAGIDGERGRLGELSNENFTRVIDVDLRGVFLGMKAALPVLVAGGGGAIVNTASIGGMVGIPGFSVYGAAKAGVIQLTRSAAIEYGPQQVRVNAICPGVVDTPGARRLPAHLIEQIAARHALGRLARAEEVAAVAAFLISDDASFVTGCAVAVDGGFTAQ